MGRGQSPFSTDIREELKTVEEEKRKHDLSGVLTILNIQVLYISWGSVLLNVFERSL